MNISFLYICIGPKVHSPIPRRPWRARLGLMPFSGRLPVSIGGRRLPRSARGRVRSTSGLVAGCKACFNHSKHLTGLRQRHERSIPARALPMVLPPGGDRRRSSGGEFPRRGPAQTRRCPGWVVPRPGLRCAGAVLAYGPVYEGLAASFWVVVAGPKFGISSSAETRRECQSPKPDRSRVTPASTKLTMEAMRAIWPICHQP